MDDNERFFRSKERVRYIKEQIFFSLVVIKHIKEIQKILTKVTYDRTHNIEQNWY